MAPLGARAIPLPHGTSGGLARDQPMLRAFGSAFELGVGVLLKTADFRRSSEPLIPHFLLPNCVYNGANMLPSRPEQIVPPLDGRDRQCFEQRAVLVHRETYARTALER